MSLVWYLNVNVRSLGERLARNKKTKLYLKKSFSNVKDTRINKDVLIKNRRKKVYYIKLK